jgi:hypothetical protein
MIWTSAAGCRRIDFARGRSRPHSSASFRHGILVPSASSHQVAPCGNALSSRSPALPSAVSYVPQVRGGGPGGVEFRARGLSYPGASGHRSPPGRSSPRCNRRWRPRTGTRTFRIAYCSARAHTPNRSRKERRRGRASPSLRRLRARARQGSPARARLRRGPGGDIRAAGGSRLAAGRRRAPAGRSPGLRVPDQVPEHNRPGPRRVAQAGHKGRGRCSLESQAHSCSGRRIRRQQRTIRRLTFAYNHPPRRTPPV